MLALMSLVLHTARTASRFLWRLVSTTHMVSWPFLIWDMASSSTSSVWLWFFTACKYRHHEQSRMAQEVGALSGLGESQFWRRDCQ